MAEDDIYGNRARYERFKSQLGVLLFKPEERNGVRGARKYYCRKPENLRHFSALLSHVEARDLSYIRRIRLLQAMRTICHFSTKDLAELGRDDVNAIVAAMHVVYQTPKSKETFIKEFKYLWKVLFPEKDERGRPDETIVPYAVRHLSAKMDKSREKLRKDKLTPDDIERIVAYFSAEPRIQAYITLSLESLARPQELLYVRIGSVELFDNYAKIFITEHGKEGVGLLQCIDSYPHLLRWLDVHPLKGDRNAFLFVNLGNTNRLEQLKPKNVNKLLRKACKDLGIGQPITCYSLKRNGVTIRRLRGQTDMEIQHAARWSSTKQLKTYDMSNQEEAFRRELEKRGLTPAAKADPMRARPCEFCGKLAGLGDVVCQQCRRPLGRDAIRAEIKERDGEVAVLRQELGKVTAQLATIRKELVRELAEELLRRQKGSRKRSQTNTRSVSLPNETDVVLACSDARR